jgi:hypothetical protein
MTKLCKFNKINPDEVIMSDYNDKPTNTTEKNATKPSDKVITVSSQDNAKIIGQKLGAVTPQETLLKKAKSAILAAREASKPSSKNPEQNDAHGAISTNSQIESHHSLHDLVLDYFLDDPKLEGDIPTTINPTYKGKIPQNVQNTIIDDIYTNNPKLDEVPTIINPAHEKQTSKNKDGLVTNPQDPRLEWYTKTFAPKTEGLKAFKKVTETAKNRNKNAQVLEELRNEFEEKAKDKSKKAEVVEELKSGFDKAKDKSKKVKVLRELRNVFDNAKNETPHAEGAYSPQTLSNKGSSTTRQ